LESAWYFNRDGRLAINIDRSGSDGFGLDSSRTTGEEEKRLVVVKWRDVIACSGWEQDVDCPVVYTAGFLVSEDDETLKIATTLDFDDFQGEAKGGALPIPYGITAFPKGCVVKVYPLSDKLEWLPFVSGPSAAG